MKIKTTDLVYRTDPVREETEWSLEEIDEIFPPGDGSLVSGLVAVVRQFIEEKKAKNNFCLACGASPEDQCGCAGHYYDLENE